MNKAAATGDHTGVSREIPLLTGALLALTMGAGQAMAAIDAAPLPAETLVAEARLEQPVRVQVQTSTLPRMEATDSGFQAPRMDVSLFPQGNASGGGIGAVLGLSTPRVSALPFGPAPATPSVDLGVRWSQRLSGPHQIDVTAWRRMSPDQDAMTLIQRQQQPVYGARVEMNLADASNAPGFAVDKGFVGLQLQSGARISIKRKNGAPMVYYRTTF